MTVPAQTPATDALPLRRKCIILTGMALIVIACYGTAAWNNQFVFDDHTVIETLPPKLALHDLAEFFGQPHYLNFLYYRPITRVTLAIQRATWGLSPRSFHLFNAVLDGLVFVAVYLLLRSRQFAIGPLAAMFAALWLALHPATSECVYPAASGRESLMPMLFIPLAIWAYLRDGWRWYVTAMVLFVVALLCKEQSVVLPGLFLLADLLWLSDTWRRKILRWIPMLLIFAGYFLLRHSIFGRHSIHIDVWQHPLQFGLSILYGLQSTIVPYVTLHYEPPFAQYVWIPTSVNPVLFGWFFWPLMTIATIILILLIIGVMRFGFSNRQSITCAAIFWLGWFVLLQLPTAHLVAEQEAPFSERYVALAALALPAILAAIISQIRCREIAEISTAAAAIWVAAFAVISFTRGSFYADDLAFNHQWELTNPQSSVAHSGMGIAYEKLGDINHAIAEYNTALACNANDWTANTAMGIILLKRGQYWPAEKHLRIVIAAHTHDPRVMVNYGLAVEMISIKERNIGFRNAARKWFEDAIRLSPDYAEAHFQLGAWHAQFGDLPAARAELQTALSHDPNLSQAKAWLDRLNSPVQH